MSEYGEYELPSHPPAPGAVPEWTVGPQEEVEIIARMRAQGMDQDARCRAEDRLLADVQEGLRLYQEGKRAEWETKSLRAKAAELWRDMPWMANLLVVAALLVTVLGPLAVILMAVID